MSFKRGDKVIKQNGLVGIVCGPEDFHDYEYNRPNVKWELVLITVGHKNIRNMSWIGNIWLKKISWYKYLFYKVKWFFV